MDGNLNLGINWSQLSTMVGPALQQELSQKLSPQQLQALYETEAFITQQGSRISVDIKFKETDADTDAVIKSLLIDGLMRAIPQVIKMFRVRAFARKLEEDDVPSGQHVDSEYGSPAAKPGNGGIE